MRQSATSAAAHKCRSGNHVDICWYMLCCWILCAYYVGSISWAPVVRLKRVELFSEIAGPEWNSCFKMLVGGATVQPINVSGSRIQRQPVRLLPTGRSPLQTVELAFLEDSCSSHRGNPTEASKTVIHTHQNHSKTTDWLGRTMLCGIQMYNNVYSTVHVAILSWFLPETHQSHQSQTQANPVPRSLSTKPGSINFCQGWMSLLNEGNVRPSLGELRTNIGGELPESPKNGCRKRPYIGLLVMLVLVARTWCDTRSHKMFSTGRSLEAWCDSSFM